MDAKNSLILNPRHHQQSENDEIRSTESYEWLISLLKKIAGHYFLIKTGGGSLAIWQRGRGLREIE